MTKQILRKVLIFVVALALLAGFAPAHSVPSARALSVPSVTVTPNTVGERAKYTVEFTLGEALAAGDEIWLYFPVGTYLPCTSCNPRILQTTVTVNGVYPILPSIGNATTRIVQVYVPKALKDGDQVTVVIDSSAGVRNPTTGGAYVLGISTTKETKRVDSPAFGIGASRISGVVVHLTDSSIVGKNSGYLVSIVTGYGGALAAGTGTVTLTFAEDTVVPRSTEESSGVSVNGVAAHHVDTNPVTRNVTITVPVAVNAVDLLSITLPSSFGLVNPGKRGEYTLFAHTSAEVGDVRSDPYVIEDVPAVATAMAITPPAPEGQDMWYLHSPLVALSAQSNKQGTLSTWYAIDDAPLAQYAQPFQIPEGVHTLRYMSKNETASLEEEVRTQELKVELSAPAITFSEGNDAILTNESTMVLHGTVASCASGIASVEIGGLPVAISTLQAVTAKLLLMEGENDISVLTRTNAGNTRLTMVRIVLDTTPPAISITSHKNWQVVTTPTIVVRGQAEEDATVVFNGTTTIVTAPDGSFQQSVTLKLGENAIGVTATDAAGNRRTASVIVMYEAQGPKTIVLMTIGSPAMTVNGTTLALDTNPLVVPVIRLGRTLVPIRSIVQALGGQAVWDAKTQRATLTLGTHKIVLTVGRPVAVVDGKSVSIDAADSKAVPTILNGRTMVPFRFVIEALGGSVQWDGARRTVTITYPKP
jgi:hypothetical protein